MLLGIDTGGTFTDFVLYDGTSLRIHKVLSTPHAPEEAILQGIAQMGVDMDGLQIVHGSTVATNAVLEGKGARTAYVTNRGLQDVLTIGRQVRQQLYNLQPAPAPTPVPRELCIETGGRLAADGELLEPLNDKELEDFRNSLEALQPQSVAINLLFSFMDEKAEKLLQSVVPKNMFVARSSEVLPEHREYERGIATWLTAYVGPLLQGYLERLQKRLKRSSLTVMQSSGATVSASQAGRLGVHLLLSGPAGGLAGASFSGAAAGFNRLLSFDMGGTSTDVALIDGEITLTSEGSIGTFPIAVPMVDMHTIGAGGGSIARLDEGGLLRVGPQSAAANPGPACYGQGGVQATVTDANLVLGRLRSDRFLGGDILLDVDAAHRAVKQLADALGISVAQAAQGIIKVANEHMARALRVISVERGKDPRDFVLTSFGGAGGLHVCALARALGIGQALVPQHGGVLSALGMLAAPRGRQLSRTMNGPLEDFSDEVIERAITLLLEQGSEALVREGVRPDTIASQASVDLRYQGQSYTLTIPWESITQSTNQFHQAHKERFGHQLDSMLELVNVRLNLRGPEPVISVTRKSTQADDSSAEMITLPDIPDAVALLDRGALESGKCYTGPLLLTEQVSTTWIEPGWSCHIDENRNIILKSEG